MSSRLASGFLSLPRELRDIVYYHYVYDEYGYHFDYESGKFRTRNGKSPIDLALLHTCKLIAAEMDGLALRLNTLNFSTAYAEAERIKAGRFDWLIASLHLKKNLSLCEAIEPHIMVSDVKDMVVSRYPQFESCLDEQTGFDSALFNNLARCWGEPRSVFYGFVDHTLHCVLENRFDDFQNALDKIHFESSRYIKPAALHQLKSLNTLPWTIPSEGEIAQLKKVVPFDYWQFLSQEDADIWKYQQHGFSATAVAIQWFQSIPKTTFLHLRNVMLLEDRESVAYPECHAMGLIEFCQMNPLLHIERRVSVWNNLLLAGSQYF